MNPTAQQSPVVPSRPQRSPKPYNAPQDWKGLLNITVVSAQNTIDTSFLSKGKIKEEHRLKFRGSAQCIDDSEEGYSRVGLSFSNSNGRRPGPCLERDNDVLLPE
jgi:hypothetical protein